MFPATPATAILHVRSPECWIGERIEIERVSGTEPAWVLVVKGMGDERSFPVRSWIEVVEGIWAGELWTDDGTVGPSFDVRPTIPQDAKRAVSLCGFLRIPLPLELIAYYHGSDGTFGGYQLHALADDDGFVATMMLSAPTGLYVRYASAWHPVTDPDVVDGLNVHGVDSIGLDMFDRLEREGRPPQLDSITQVTVTGPPGGL